MAPPAAIDIEGTNDPNNNYLLSKNFQVTPGVHVSVEQSNPLFLLRLCFTNELVDMIVTQTNSYTEQYIASYDLRSSSRVTKLTIITKD